MKYVLCTIVVGVCAVFIPFSAYGQQETQATDVQLTEPSVPDETDEAVSERDWWGQLHAAAHSCFDGGDFRVDLSGVAARTLGDQVQLTVPLYSRLDQQKRAQERGLFLEHGAGILAAMHEAKGKLAVKTEQAEVLRTVMLSSGLEGISAFFRIKEEIVVLEAQVEGAEMKLSGLIESCVSGKKGYVAGR